MEEVELTEVNMEEVELTEVNMDIVESNPELKELFEKMRSGNLEGFNNLVNNLVKECQTLDVLNQKKVIKAIGRNGYLKCLKLMKGINALASAEEFKQRLKKLDDDGIVSESKHLSYDKTIIFSETDLDLSRLDAVKILIPIPALRKSLDILLSFLVSNIQEEMNSDKLMVWNEVLENRTLFQKEILYVNEVGLVQGFAVKVHCRRSSRHALLLGFGSSQCKLNIGLDIVQLVPLDIKYEEDDGTESIS